MVAAPFAGLVIAVDWASGEPVRPGAVLVVLEAMKMEHEVLAEIDGLVARVEVAVGQTVEEGQALIVLDCCERVVGGAAVVAERLLEVSPDLRILATSREALRAEGEVFCRLPALETPPDIDGLTAIEALGFPAIQLFVERVTWTIDDFELSDADAPIVANICRSLDGIALAIELAAGRVDAFGVRDLAAHLNDRLRQVLNQLAPSGRRPAKLPGDQIANNCDFADQNGVFA